MQGMKERDEQNGEKARKLGVTGQNLTVKGVSSDATFTEDVISQFNLFGNGGRKVTEAGQAVLVTIHQP